jgi:hypothetical protein
MNIEMQKLTEQGVKENKLMKKLTQKSTQDTRSMMTIALISAIFLPATFLAVRLSLCSSMPSLTLRRRCLGQTFSAILKRKTN